MNINFLRQHSTNYIFDFDGTISDTLNIHENAFKEALKTITVNFLYSDYLGHTTESTINKILQKNNIELSAKEVSEIVFAKRKFANDLIKTYITFWFGSIILA